jgi:hypothetical protein
MQGESPAWTGVIDCDFSGGFGNPMLALDIDSDGIEEVLGGSPTLGYRSFDIDTRTVDTQLVADDARSAILADVEGGGIPELLLGTGSVINCKVKVLEPLTGVVKFELVPEGNSVHGASGGRCPGRRRAGCAGRDGG